MTVVSAVRLVHVGAVVLVLIRLIRAGRDRGAAEDEARSW